MSDNRETPDDGLPENAEFIAPLAIVIAALVLSSAAGILSFKILEWIFG